MIEVLQLKSGMSVNKMVKGSEESKGWSGEDLRGRRGGASESMMMQRGYNATFE